MFDTTFGLLLFVVAPYVTLVEGACSGTEVDGSCFVISNSNGSFFNSISHCASISGRLAHISSESTSSAVISYLQSNTATFGQNFWVGGVTLATAPLSVTDFVWVCANNYHLSPTVAGGYVGHITSGIPSAECMYYSVTSVLSEIKYLTCGHNQFALCQIPPNTDTLCSTQATTTSSSTTTTTTPTTSASTTSTSTTTSTTSTTSTTTTTPTTTSTTTTPTTTTTTSTTTTTPTTTTSTTTPTTTTTTTPIPTTTTVKWLNLTADGRFGNDYVYQEILSQVLNETVYKVEIRPYAENGQRANVMVSIFLRSISGISEQDMEFSADFDLILRWMDPRLAFGNITSTPINSYMLVRQDNIKNIWLPGVYFENERKGNVHQLMQTNAAMRIYANGTLVYGVRVTVTFACTMRLGKYPMDSQWCDMLIGTFNYPIEDLMFHWDGLAPVEYSNTLTNSKFKVITSETEATYCEFERRRDIYSCLRLKLRFNRDFPFHIIQTYVPTCILVMASWLSFWIDPAAVPARVALNVTTLLSIVTMMTAVRVNLPPVSDVKAIDVWMFMCTLYIFGAMLEYSLVGNTNIFTKCRKKKVDLGLLTKVVIYDSSMEGGWVSHQNAGKPSSSSSPWYTDVDKISRVIFPATFIVFNVVYWVTYLV